MTQMSDFYTRDKANEGIKLPLSKPDGTKTDHYVHILGRDSDAFREADAEAKRNALKIAQIDDETELKKSAEEAKLSLIAKLVIGWSFEEELTFENIKTFLKEAPQIADKIDQVAGMRALFFKEK